MKTSLSQTPSPPKNKKIKFDATLPSRHKVALSFFVFNVGAFFGFVYNISYDEIDHGVDDAAYQSLVPAHWIIPYSYFPC
jgi:hypothetical protein